jgi:hypothetical protein
MGAKLGCLVNGTKEIQLIRDIMHEMAAESIGVLEKPFYFPTAYNMLIKAGIEIDIESVAVLYMEEFDTTDAWFSTTEDVESRAGREFQNILDKVANAQPFTDVVTIGERSPGAAAADTIMKFYADMSSPNLGVQSVMKLFQEKMTKAAKTFVDKDINIDAKIEAIEKQIADTESRPVSTSDPVAFNDYNNRLDVLYNMRYNANVDKGRIDRDNNINEKQAQIDALDPTDPANKADIDNLKTEIRELIKEKKTFLDNNPKVKEDLSFIQILSQAFMMNKKGYMNEVTGVLNSTKEVVDEFKREMQQYIDESIASGKLDDAQAAQIEKYAEDIINQSYNLLLSNKEISALVKDALVKNGFAKKKKRKDGTETVVFDWTKLTDAANDTEYLKEKVTESLSKYGFNPTEIDIINNAIKREYDSLRADIIEKRINELNKRNKIKLAPENASKSKTLALLYNMGWFESDPTKYEKIINDMLGLSEIDKDMFNELEQIGRALNELYKNAKESDQFVKTSINNINEQIASLLNKYAKDKSKLYRAARILQSFMSLVMRTRLYTVSNSVIANNFSGWFARYRTHLQSKIDGTYSKEASDFSKQMAKIIRTDITGKGGLQYGDLSSTYVVRGDFDTWLNSQSDSKGYHQAISWLTGRWLLDGQDSYFKFRIVNTVFNRNMINIVENIKRTEFEKELRKKYKDELDSTNHAIYQAAEAKISREIKDNKKRFREESMREINEQLYGDSFEQKKIEAKEIIDHANRAAGKKIAPDHEEAVARLASDMVKLNLLNLKNIKKEHIMAAYNSAYKSGGYDLGHVPNNILSKNIQNQNAFFSEKVNNAIADGNYSMAAMWSVVHTLFNTVANPFMGGGTNWLIMKSHGLGLGMLRSKFGSGERINDIQDLTTDEGLSKLEKTLWEENKRTSQFVQGAAGMVANLAMGSVLLMVLASYLKPEGEEDERPLYVRISDFIEQNKSLRKFYKDLPVQYVYYMSSMLSGEFKRLKDLIGIEFDQFSYTTMISEYIKLLDKGETAEAKGKLGEISGKSLGHPLPFLRMIDQVREIYNGGNQSDYEKSRSFMHGFFKSGIFNSFGNRDVWGLATPAYEISSLPGVGEAGIKGFKELGVNDMNDLRNYIIQNGDMDDIAGSIRGMKKPDKNGKMIPIVNTEESYIIEEIMYNNNKPVKMLENMGFDGDQIKVLKKNKIYTVSQLWERTGDLSDMQGLNMTEEQSNELLVKMKEYMEDVTK